MNLCGGIAGVEDHELSFRFPDEEFSTSSRKKSFSSSQSLTSRRDKSTSGRSLRRQSSSSSRHSTRSGRGGGVLSSSQSVTSAPKTSTLNAISYEKHKTRNRSRSAHGMKKGSSILTRKLESGFKLVRAKWCMT